MIIFDTLKNIYNVHINYRHFNKTNLHESFPNQDSLYRVSLALFCCLPMSKASIVLNFCAFCFLTKKKCVCMCVYKYKCTYICINIHVFLNKIFEVYKNSLFM